MGVENVFQSKENLIGCSQKPPNTFPLTSHIPTFVVNTKIVQICTPNAGAKEKGKETGGGAVRGAVREGVGSRGRGAEQWGRPNQSLRTKR